jgi:hypothetical protein
MAKRAKRPTRRAGRSAKAKKTVRAKPARKKAAARRTATARKTARPRKAAGRAATSARRRSSTPKRAATRRPTPKVRAKPRVRAAATPSRLNRERRILEEPIPSSLNFNQHGSAASTGRMEIAESLREHATMEGDALTAGDPDVNVENAYFSGDEAPGGDNPTPDQDIVDDIGRAVGIQYEDNEELTGSDKDSGRDKHRWELDPASSEDYKDRK